MCELVINGGNCLRGEIRVQGSKNSALPILAATILTDDECVIHNCPDISDTHIAIDILREFGVCVRRDGRRVFTCAKNMDGSIIRKELMQKMRSSIMFMGAVLAKRGETVICFPGGCRLGERPIDIHLKSLSRLGAEVNEIGDCISCKLQKLCDEDITLLYPSVGATENIMMMCALSDKEVRIFNPAREPEIVDLQNFLNLMGADIKGAGSDMIRIRGVNRLHGCEYTVMPDRIAASTYACAVAACGGDVFIRGAEAGHMRIVVETLKEIGCGINADQNGLRIAANGRPNSVNMIKTLPYPGFPTDVQPMLGAVLAKANGVSKISETIFDSRFEYLAELKKMGAKVDINGSVALIHGVFELWGANVKAMDLRGGAALVTAGLSAKGTTVVSEAIYIDRGYERIEDGLKGLGADILRV